MDAVEEHLDKVEKKLDATEENQTEQQGKGSSGKVNSKHCHSQMLCHQWNLWTRNKQDNIVINNLGEFSIDDLDSHKDLELVS